jgi:hypothetical protein
MLRLRYENLKSKKFISYLVMALFIVLTYLSFLGMLTYIPGLSGMPYAINKALVGCLVLKLVDEFMLYEVPTMKILKENATAYSLYMLAYGIIIALAISGA